VADLEASAERPKLYLDTSVISYLTARPSRNTLARARQELTRDWWEHRRENYELFTSELVREEAEQGDPRAARARTAIVAETRVLLPNRNAELLARALLKAAGLSRNALGDMSHVASATLNRRKFLLTWNCKHLANANVLHAVAKICRERGYEPPLICTPDELPEV
jgi:predicted nucleic acid-binding protein